MTKVKSLHLPRRAAMTLLLTVLTLTAWALDPVFSTTYTATSGTTGNANEDYGNLVDGKKNTKWCVSNCDFSGSNTLYIEFHSDIPFVPTGYVMTTGNDTQSNSGRNPKSWTIQAKLYSTDAWEFDRLQF